MSITALAPVAAVPMLTAKAVIRSGSGKAGVSACGAAAVTPDRTIAAIAAVIPGTTHVDVFMRASFFGNSFDTHQRPAARPATEVRIDRRRPQRMRGIGRGNLH